MQRYFMVRSAYFGFLLLVSLSTPLAAWAQAESSSGDRAELRSPCRSLTGAIISEVTLAPEESTGSDRPPESRDKTTLSASSSVEEVSDAISGFLGIRQGFSVRKATNVDNACAAIDGRNRRVLYYNFDFIDGKTRGNVWKKIGIVSHEIGHHINNHPLEVQAIDAWQQELQADEFAGSLMQKLGAGLDDALAFTEVLAVTSSSYPDREFRKVAIEQGYRKASGEVKVSNRVRLPLELMHDLKGKGFSDAEIQAQVEAYLNGDSQ
jgi:hypothetical protein